MTTYDFSPLYRSAIGFDRLANLFESARASQNNYPPYNVERVGENRYRITMAIAGFSINDLDIELKSSILTVRGDKKEKPQAREFLYQGIAERAFEQRFQLADHIKVVDARLENGMLNIELVRELPEEMKPRKIEIQTEQAVTATVDQATAMEAAA